MPDSQATLLPDAGASEFEWSMKLKTGNYQAVPLSQVSTGPKIDPQVTPTHNDLKADHEMSHGHANTLVAHFREKKYLKVSSRDCSSPEIRRNP
jgi:hypothetical protein